MLEICLPPFCLSVLQFPVYMRNCPSGLLGTKTVMREGRGLSEGWRNEPKDKLRTSGNLHRTGHGCSKIFLGNSFINLGDRRCPWGLKKEVGKMADSHDELDYSVKMSN